MADDVLTSAPIASSATSQGDVAVLVCASCRYPGQEDVSPRPGSQFAEAVRIAANYHEVAFRRVSCLGNCKRGLTAAVMRDGCWSYVFGELSAENAADLIAAAQLLAGSSDGLMPYGQRPQALKSRLIARIPSFANLETLPT